MGFYKPLITMSKNTNNTKNVQIRQLNNIKFIIDDNQLISTRQCGHLGHLEDCIQVAEALSDLFSIGEEISMQKQREIAVL